MAFENIKLYVPSDLSTNEIGAAYARLALGLAQKLDPLLNAYIGPKGWLEAILAEPPDLLMLRHHAVAVATAVQKSQLPRNRKERLLRNVRGLLWLIRAGMGERIMFSEQVRMLLDLKAEHVADEVFQSAHEALSDALSGGSPLASRWATWQASYTVPATTALPHLSDAVAYIKARLGAHSFDTSAGPSARFASGCHSAHRKLRAPALLTKGDIEVVAVAGDGVPFYQQGQLCVPEQGRLRIDRLYHLAARLGYGGTHTVHTAIRQRYAAGEAECAVLLNWGSDQVLVQGLYQSLLSELDLYGTAIPALLRAAGLPARTISIQAEQLRAIHAAEEILQWSKANAALLLHGQKMRSRAVRRHLVANALMTRQQADDLLEELADPIRAAHVFAPLIGGPLIKAWLANDNHSISALLTDPPVPSSMVFEVRFAN